MMKSLLSSFLFALAVCASAWGQTDAKAQFKAANVAYAAGDYKAAIAGYESILAERMHFDSEYNLGNAQQRTGEFDKAISSYEFALVIDEEFSPALLQKAAALTMMEDYLQALECYRESILMDAPQANTYTLMGECMERMGKLSEASDYYYCALELDGEFADAMWASVWWPR